MNWSIQPLKEEVKKSLQHKIDTKTKPLGALGQLETLALQIGLIQQTTSPKLTEPHLMVFAADHGIATSGVSAYPQEVTHQMVLNFLAGGAAINVFAAQHDITLKVVDAGVNHSFENIQGLVNAKVAFGTESFLNGPAMTMAQCKQALAKGSDLVEEIAKTGCNVIGFGEMGIGNTSSASMLMHVVTGIPLQECIGAGTGLNSQGLKQKYEILSSALSANGKPNNAYSTLATYGGFEVAMMCGAMLKAAELNMLVLVDGFIATSAFLMATEFNASAKEYAIFCHKSDEKGHALLLEFLEANPLLDLQMRLGEGTGCAMAYPIIQSAVNFLNEMASFESAGVSDK